MSTKFEQLLDLLVNEEMDKANELFHTIVVEKSREIYETMIAEEEETDEESDDEAVEENFGEEDEESMYEIGGDAADELVGDVEAPASPEGDDDFGDDEEDDFGGDAFGADAGGAGDEPATKDDILDLASALDEIKAEFAALLAGEKHEEEEDPEVHGGALDALDLPPEGGEEVDSSAEADEQFMREYKEVVGKPYAGGKVAGKTEEAGTNTTSPVSSAKGRPTTTASAKNLAQGATGVDSTVSSGGLLGKVKGEFTGSHLNKVGGIKGEVFTKNAAGHGAEKKGSGEGSTNSKPIVDRQQ